MNITILNKYWQMLTVICMAVILLWALWAGWNKGVLLAQSQVIASNARQLEKSFDYFYNDQGRYMTADEFTDQNILGQYIHTLPLSEFVSKTCSATFVYKRPAPNQYQLQFCLPTAAGSYSSGWNQLSGSK